MSEGKGNEENVRVVVRVRPISKKEYEKGCRNVLQVDPANNTIVIENPALELDTQPKSYKFDAVFPQDTSQADLYNIVARPLVESVIEGYHGTIFAYGQTGTGKTFTMEGNNEPELRGIIPNSFAQLFSHIANASGDQRFLVRVSYLEIYNEDVRDLLCKNSTRLEIKERTDSGVYVKDLSSIVVRNADEMNRILKIGNKLRSTGATNMNLTSSRSHAIFSINVECSTDSKDGKERKIRMGKLNLVDLAGSERVAKTGATGQRLKEGAKINLSLSCLGNVISALVEAQQHIPYRSSKLTRLLQDSLGGNSKTVMCANIGPADYNYEETLSTLRYANRAKRIKNYARINEDPKDALLRQYENEIAELRRQLEEEHGAGLAAETLESLENDDDLEDEDFDEDDEENPDAGLMHTENLQLRPMTGVDDEVLEIKEAIESHEKLASDIGAQDQEKQQVFQELKHNVKTWKRKEEAKSNLREKLKQIKRKIMVGGENLLSKSQLQEQLLQKSMQELEHRKEEETRLKTTLQAKAVENAAAQQKIAELEDYSVMLSKRWRKCLRKYSKEKSELDILTDECENEGGSAMEDIVKMSKELQFVDQILEGYIPPKAQEAIESSCTWNEDSVRWSLPCIAFSGNNIDHTAMGHGSGSSHKSSRLEAASNDPELMLAPRNICNNSYRSIKSKDNSQSIIHQQQNGSGASASGDDDFLSQLPKFITSTHELTFTKDGKPQITFAGNFYV